MKIKTLRWKNFENFTFEYQIVLYPSSFNPPFKFQYIFPQHTLVQIYLDMGIQIFRRKLENRINGIVRGRIF